MAEEMAALLARINNRSANMKKELRAAATSNQHISSAGRGGGESMTSIPVSLGVGRLRSNMMRHTYNIPEPGLPAKSMEQLSDAVSFCSAFVRSLGGKCFRARRESGDQGVGRSGSKGGEGRGKHVGTAWEVVRGTRRTNDQGIKRKREAETRRGDDECITEEQKQEVQGAAGRSGGIRDHKGQAGDGRA